ncbi:MAG: guanylate kinase [Paludibacteraceae bacterium]|nr:guanylate kinase [Paludibacteraceae bacterium]
MIFIFSAPSGSGKSTLVNYLLQEFPNLEFSVSATSRKPRGQEKDGVEYYFKTPQEFRRLIDNNELVEFEEVYPDLFYGTLKSEIERIQKKGNHVVFDVDVKGGRKLEQIFGDEALSIFIAPPSVEELRKRLVKRGTDTPEMIDKRVGKAAEEMQDAKYFDKIILNDDLEKAKQELQQTVLQHLNKK